VDVGDVISVVVIVAIVIGVIIGIGALWSEEQKKLNDSIKEEVVTIKSVVPVPGLKANSYGQIIIDNAADLMFITTDGRTFMNYEDPKMNKYETGDILNNLQVGGTYKIRYYGWRDGQRSLWPNILCIVQVVDESNVTEFRDRGDWIGIWDGPKNINIKPDPEDKEKN